MNPIKCKYADIKAVMSWHERFGDQYEDIKDLIGTQPHAHCIAYYTPSQANWSYRIELVKYNKTKLCARKRLNMQYDKKVIHQLKQINNLIREINNNLRKEL